MEKFKAVEKEMKTKAFSKEGLSAAAKLDPKEREKLEGCQFLSEMVEDLERQIETLEAEEESLQVTVKKGKKDTGKADRLSEITRLTERHKWHQGKLELLLRSLENGNVDVDQVNDLKDSIKYYVEENQAVEFMEDDTIYDDLNLEQEEGAWGIGNDADRVSSQDAQSIADDLPETADGRGGGTVTGKSKVSSVSDQPSAAAARRPSNQLKSPLPALATLHTPLANISNGSTNNNMKPAPLPTRPPGETLKYASAAAAAASSEKNTLGIAPLPPPPGATVQQTNPGLSPLPPASAPKSSATTSPSVTASLPVSVNQTPALKNATPATTITDAGQTTQASARSPTLSHSSVAAGTSVPNSIPPTPALEKAENVSPPAPPSKSSQPLQPSAQEQKDLSPEPEQPQTPPQPVGQIDPAQANGEPELEQEDESIYHLPTGLQELIQSFEITKTNASSEPSPSIQRLLTASHATCPDIFDAEKPRHYKPQTKYDTPRFYPQEPSIIIDDPNLYGRIDTDTLFFIFYYRQGTYQQYLAAKSLKTQSWRFHKQYQTWFQRHEEPKTITEEYEQGTYRFFDYESTWYVFSPLLS